MRAGRGRARRAWPSTLAPQPSGCRRSFAQAGCGRPSLGSEHERSPDRQRCGRNRCPRTCRSTGVGRSPGHPCRAEAAGSCCCSIQSRTSETANFRCFPNRYARGPTPARPPVVDRRDRHLEIRGELFHVQERLQPPRVAGSRAFDIHTKQVRPTPPRSESGATATVGRVSENGPADAARTAHCDDFAMTRSNLTN